MPSREASRYIRAARAMLRKAGHPAAAVLAEHPNDPARIRAALAKPDGDIKNKTTYLDGRSLALHAAALLEGAEFRYAKVPAASAKGARLSDCILFKSGDRRLLRDTEAYRIMTTNRPDGKDVDVSDGSVPMTTDARTMEAAGAVRVRRKGWPFPVWAETEPKEE